MSGFFITFEGGEGVGKTTQIEVLSARLEAQGHEVVCMREPGGTRVGDRVRAVLLDTANAGMDPWAEVFLYEACRAQLVRERIVPALERGAVVLCDRFTDSTLAYQGYGRGLDLEALRTLNARATDGLAPHATVVLDLPCEEGIERATRHGADRLESEDGGFHARVKEGFLAQAASEPERVCVVDASGSIHEVAIAVLAGLGGLPGVAHLLSEEGA